jgi:hypothetical protein
MEHKVLEIQKSMPRAEVFALAMRASQNREEVTLDCYQHFHGHSDVRA